jgi:hypothetical protein
MSRPGNQSNRTQNNQRRNIVQNSGTNNNNNKKKTGATYVINVDDNYSEKDGAGKNVRSTGGGAWGPKGPGVIPRDGVVSRESKGEYVYDENDCVVCYKKLETFSLAGCGHKNVCMDCSIRMREVYENFHCPVCMVDTEFVVITEDKTKVYSDYDLNSLFFYEDARAYVATEKYIGELRSVNDFICTRCEDEKKSFSSLYALKSHIKAIHNLFYCDTCLEKKKCFLSEQVLYSAQELKNHAKVGDKKIGIKPHPKCEFCINTNIYDDEDLYEHCREHHLTCFLCDRNNVQWKYFINYEHLENHFSQDHFLCENETCKASKFVAFATEIDYRIHLLKQHKDSLSKDDVQDLKRVNLNFNMKRNDSSPSKSGTSTRSSTPEPSPTVSSPWDSPWDNSPWERSMKSANTSRQDESIEYELPAKEYPGLTSNTSFDTSFDTSFATVSYNTIISKNKVLERQDFPSLSTNIPLPPPQWDVKKTKTAPRKAPSNVTKDLSIQSDFPTLGGSSNSQELWINTTSPSVNRQNKGNSQKNKNQQNGNKSENKNQSGGNVTNSKQQTGNSSRNNNQNKGNAQKNNNQQNGSTTKNNQQTTGNMSKKNNQTGNSPKKNTSTIQESITERQEYPSLRGNNPPPKIPSKTNNQGSWSDRQPNSNTQTIPQTTNQGKPKVSPQIEKQEYPSLRGSNPPPKILPSKTNDQGQWNSNQQNAQPIPQKKNPPPKKQINPEREFPSLGGKTVQRASTPTWTARNPKEPTLGILEQYIVSGPDKKKKKKPVPGTGTRS